MASCRDVGWLYLVSKFICKLVCVVSLGYLTLNKSAGVFTQADHVMRQLAKYLLYQQLHCLQCSQENCVIMSFTTQLLGLCSLTSWSEHSVCKLTNLIIFKFFFQIAKYCRSSMFSFRYICFGLFKDHTILLNLNKTFILCKKKRKIMIVHD